jgi:hypothetical protein
LRKLLQCQSAKGKDYADFAMKNTQRVRYRQL